MSVADLPKTEIHIHQEGAAPPAFIRMLASEQGLALEGVFDAEGQYQWRDFAEFLRCYMAATAVLKTPDHTRRLVETVLRAQAAQGVIYTEHFIAPHISGGGDPVLWREHLAAMDEGAQAVPEIEARWIATAIRNLGPEAAEVAAGLAVAEQGGRLTGFGMGGEERYLRPTDFARAFAIAAEAGLGLTCHGGEWCGPEAIAETLRLGVTRLGHGIRAVESAALCDRLVAEGVVLEVNPGSNVSLGAVAGWEDHPIETLRRRGVAVTVSTDDPPYFHTTMRREYEGLERHFGWTARTFNTANRVALGAAFCDDATRARLMPRFEETA